MERMTRVSNLGVIVPVHGQQEALSRLAAYEDTGLTPEEVRAIQALTISHAYGAAQLIMGACEPWDRVVDIARAEAEGRLVVLPCKVGDRVWMLLDKLRNGEKEIVESRFVYFTLHREFEHYSCYIDCPAIGNTLEYHREDFGKTIFLTREEAEAALAKEVTVC